MKLANAAKFFDRLVCQDAYGNARFNAQFNLYDDATRDGLGAVRRILSTAPEVVVPSRRVIAADSEQWLIGDSHTDYFGNGAIRRKYIAHKADALAAIRSFGEFLSGNHGATAYAARVWIKTSKQVEVSSELFNVYDVLFSASEKIPAGSVVTIGDEHYLAFASYTTEGGFRAVRAMELPDPLVDGEVVSRAYNPTTDTYADTHKVAKLIKVRWQDHFEYFAQYAPSYKVGDVQLIVLRAVGGVSVGDHIKAPGCVYRAIEVTSEGDVWSIHGRPA